MPAFVHRIVTDAALGANNAKNLAAFFDFCQVRKPLFAFMLTASPPSPQNIQAVHCPKISDLRPAAAMLPMTQEDGGLLCL